MKGFWILLTVESGIFLFNSLQRLIYSRIVSVADLIISLGPPDLPGQQGPDAMLQYFFIPGGDLADIDRIPGSVGRQAIPELFVIMAAGYAIGRAFKSFKSRQVRGIVGIDEATVRPVYIERRDIFSQGAGVKSDKDIGGDASPAVHGPFVLTQGRIGRPGMSGRSISMQHFPVMKAVEHFLIIVIVSLTIGLLNAASGGGIIPGYRQAQGGTVAQLVLFLYQAFTKGPSADDRAPVPVLKGSCQYFAGGSGAFVRKKG